MVGGIYWAEDAETTDFGAPKSHDGTLKVEKVIYMPSLDDVSAPFWLEMFTNYELDWAVVGISRSSGQPGGPRRG